MRGGDNLNEFENFDQEFEREFKQAKRTMTTYALWMIFIFTFGNVVIWGGLLAAILWVLTLFGVI